MISFDNKAYNLLQNGFEKDLFRACLDNLNEENNALRLSNFSFALRELFREVLCERAPDEEVKRCSWFVPNQDAPNCITRADRMKYAIQGGLPDHLLDMIMRDLVSDTIAYTKAQIDRLSKYTHITKGIFYSTEDKDKQAVAALETFEGLLTTIEDGKVRFAEMFADHINDEIFNIFFYNTVDEIDTICSHHYINYFDVTSLQVTTIDSANISFEVSGIVSVQLQFGSSLDIRNDIGYWMDVEYPFGAKLRAPIPKSLCCLDLEFDCFNVDVDNPEFYSRNSLEG